MARRMFSVDQISSQKPASLELYMHNVHISSFDGSMNAYITVYSVNSSPATTKQELIDNLLLSMYMPATGFAESHTKIIYAIYQSGQLLYTDLQGTDGLYSDDYTVEDQVVSIGG